MEETLYSSIMSHCSLMDQINGITEKIEEAGKAGDVETILAESENKQRAINVLAQIQTKIENILGNMPVPLSAELLSIVRCWADDFTAITERWNQQDATTAAFLEKAREQTTKEIASVFKSRERHKGYNLANVKK